MAAITLRPDLQRFPVGTSVGVYLRSAWPGGIVFGAPQGAAIATVAVAADGTLPFTGLGFAVEYVGYAASPDRFLRFSPGSYYVSSAGNDSNDGASPATPWKTLAKVNGATFVAGDRVLLRRGDRWKEILTVPRSSLALGAYGDSPIYDSEGYCTNAPVIDGGEPQGSWSPYAGGAEVRTIVDAMTGVAGTNLSAHTPTVGTDWAKHVIYPTFDAVLSNANRLRRAATATNIVAYYADPVVSTNDYYVQCDVFLASTAVDFVTIMARWFSYKDSGYGFTLGSTGSLTARRYDTATPTTLGVGTGLTMVALDSWTIRLEVSGNQVTAMVKPTGAGTWSQTLGPFTDNTHTEGNNSGLKLGSATAVAGGDAVGMHVDNFECGPLGVVGSPTNTYQSTLPAQAWLIEQDGALGIRGPNTDQLANGQWYWQSGTLYVRRDAGSPPANAVIVATRLNGINVGARTDTTIQDIAIEHTSNLAVRVDAGGHRTTVQRCYAQRASTIGTTSRNGVFGAVSANDFTVQGSVIRECDNDGIYVQQGLRPVFTDNLVRTIQGVASDCIQSDGQGLTVNGVILRNRCSTLGSNSPKGCIIVFGDGYTIDENYCQGSGGAGRASGNYGISIGSGNAYKIRRNTVYNMSNDGIRITCNGDTTEIRDDFTVVGNVVIDCGIGIYLVVRGTHQHWYNNTIVNVARVPQFNGANDNIVWDATGSGRAMRLIQVTTTPDSDYNIFSPQAANFINWGGTLYSTLATYSAAQSKDSHSSTVDPGFVNSKGTARKDFALRSDSPARGLGVLVPDYAVSSVAGAVV
jgi:hypothetical protein